MNLRDRFILEYSDLSEYETRAGQLCPLCEGGNDGRKTLSVSRRNGILLWHCHRDSCTFSGRYGGRPGATKQKEKQSRGMVGRTYVRDAETIPEEARELLHDKYKLTGKHLSRAQYGWDRQSNRLVQPVLSSDGEVLGACLRALDGREPKSLTHMEAHSVGWYRKRGSHSLIIVEDLFSALRASDYCNSVALMSTHLNEERINVMKRAGFNSAFIALDRDAYAKSIQYVMKFRSMIKLTPVSLSKDIKDMSIEESDGLFKKLGV